MQLLSKLQKFAATDFNGLVTKNNLGAIYMDKPYQVNNMIKEIYRTSLIDDQMSFIEEFPVVEVPEGKFYEWMLQGQHDKNIPLQDWYDSVGAKPTEPGKNLSRFYMVFAEDYFEPDNIILGHREDYHLRVVSVIPTGNLYQYEVELLTDDINLFIPPDELFAGSRWSKDYNVAPSTLSNRGARPNFTSPFSMRNIMSQMRMEYDVPGNMIGVGKNDPLMFEFMGPEGKREKVWINYQDMVAYFQFRQQFARMHVYGKKNWTDKDIFLNKDASGRFQIESGAGLFEQIAPSNVHYYSTYDIDFHLSVLLDMGVGTIERGKRTITLLTGEFGAQQFHLAAQNNSTKYTPNLTQDRIYTTKNSNLGPNRQLGYGGQFVEYDYINGVKIQLRICPFFDDRIRFKDEHPNGGVTESYRMIALDYGGESGIKRVRPKGQNPIFAYVNGLRDPFSPSGTGAAKQVVSGLDGYSVHRMDWGGMMVEDPTKIVDFRYNFVRS